MQRDPMVVQTSVGRAQNTVPMGIAPRQAVRQEFATRRKTAKSYHALYLTMTAAQQVGNDKNEAVVQWIFGDDSERLDS